MKKLYTLLLLTTLPFVGFSQTITGKVQESDGKPMPFVNVLLLHSKDSTLAKGAVSDETGAYLIDNVRPGNYLLAATMVGYTKTYSQPVIVKEGQQDVKMSLLTLAYDTRQLKEVSVVTTRPFVEQQIDRTVVNVANSIISSGSTALEVLEKAPGVTIDRQNDGIALRGKQGVIVQIDGKQTYLSMADVVALLRSMPSDNIDNIELITNPSARYDAAGNSGIINIRMKKNNNVGTNGSLSVAGGFGRYDRERAGMQLNHRANKVNLFASYNGNQGGSYWDFESYRDWTENGERTIINQVNYLHFLSWGHNAKAGVDYFIGQNTTIGLVWTGAWNSFREKGPTETRFRHTENQPEYFQTYTEKTQATLSNNQVGNINLQHTFGAKGGQLTADFDLGRFRRSYSNTLLTNTLLSEEPLQPLSGLYIQMPTTINIRTVKLDYNRSFGKDTKLEAGLKHSSVSSDNDMTLSSGEDGKLEVDPALSNHFLYDERVNAAYLNMAGKFGASTKWQAGLRVEHTHSVGNSLNLDNKVTRNYLNFFPSLFVSQPLSGAHNLTFSYSYRIDRPNYQNLNPARGYIDPYAYSRGNPFLKPQYTHSLELKHGYKDKIFTSLGASYTTDLVYFLIQPVDLNRFERTPDNIGNSRAYNLTVSFPLTIFSGWTLQTNLMGIYGHFSYTYLDTPLTVRQVSGRFNASNSFVLGRGWTAELTGWVNTPAVDAIWHSPWLGSLDAGLQKSLGSKWKAKLSVQDILHTNRIIGYISAAGYYNQFHIFMDTRVAMLNLTYAFGNQQLKGMRQRRIGSEEEMKRTN